MISAWPVRVSSSAATNEDASVERASAASSVAGRNFASSVQSSAVPISYESRCSASSSVQIAPRLCGVQGPGFGRWFSAP